MESSKFYDRFNNRLNSKGFSTAFVPMLFVVLSIIGIWVSGLSVRFVANEVVNRFIRNGVMVLALIVPIKAGMGLNFSITVGAMCAQVGLITVIALGMFNVYGSILAILLSILLAVVFGVLIGLALNKVKGKEMITTIIIGFLANSLYQLIFLVCVGGLIPVKNEEIILSRGIGVRNLVDLKAFRGSLDQLMLVKIFGVDVPVFMIIVVFIFGGLLYYLLNTPFGQKVKAIGMDTEKAKMVGIDSNVIRIKAIVVSTVIAAIGQLIYLQNIGMLNVYTGHLKHEIFASAALLAGGATIKDAKIKQGFIGLVLFHTLFIVSPQGGQNLFANPALGEYFRSFVAYGTIAFALVVNLKVDEGVLHR